MAREFGDSRRKDTDGHPEIEMAVVEVYRESGQESYLELAQQLVAGIVLSAVAFLGPVASAISDWSRAAADVVTLLRSLLDDDSGGCSEP